MKSAFQLEGKMEKTELDHSGNGGNPSHGAGCA